MFGIPVFFLEAITLIDCLGRIINAFAFLIAVGMIVDNTIIVADDGKLEFWINFAAILISIVVPCFYGVLDDLGWITYERIIKSQ